VAGVARKADNLTAICEPIVKKMLETCRLTTAFLFFASLFLILFYVTFS
jgi:hypothetical protein